MTQQESPADHLMTNITPEAMTKISAGGFSDLVGLRFTEISLERVRGEWVVGPHLHQPAGIVNGGVYCTVVETLASVGGGFWFGARGTVVGVNNNTDFLRAVREGTLYGEATPIHRGRTQQLWQVVVTDAEARVAARGQVRLQNLAARD